MLCPPRRTDDDEDGSFKFAQIGHLQNGNAPKYNAFSSWIYRQSAFVLLHPNRLVSRRSQ
jgi:hypothetical protein